MPDRLVIVVPDAEEESIRNRIVDLAALGWEQSIHLVGGPIRRARGDAARTEARRILKIVDDFDARSLIVAKEIYCDSTTIDRSGDLDSFSRPALGALRSRVIKHELDGMGLSWRPSLQKHLSRWDAKKHDVDDWLAQFNDLGAGWIGETLLRQIDVIDPDEVFQAFQMTPQAMVGQSHTFTYIPTADPGSSSNRIGGVLARSYGLLDVRDFEAALTDTTAGGRLIVCEDALWTGIELRDVLDRLSEGGDLTDAARGKHVVFRHCVVTDYGLWLIRHYLNHKSLGATIDLALGDRQRFIRVLTPDTNEAEIRSRWDMPPIEFEDWLTTRVGPIAFQNSRLWKGRQQEARAICEEIGKQLIEKFSSDTDKTWRKPVLDAFALGASRFGSTIAFAHSVPKACLPVFWLEGNITIGSTKLDWKPLFYDARRIPTKR